LVWPWFSAFLRKQYPFEFVHLLLIHFSEVNSAVSLYLRTKQVSAVADRPTQSAASRGAKVDAQCDKLATELN